MYLIFRNVKCQKTPEISCHCALLMSICSASISLEPQHNGLMWFTPTCDRGQRNLPYDRKAPRASRLLLSRRGLGISFF